MSYKGIDFFMFQIHVVGIFFNKFRFNILIFWRFLNIIHLVYLCILASATSYTSGKEICKSMSPIFNVITSLLQQKQIKDETSMAGEPANFLAAPAPYFFTSGSGS